MPDKDYYWKNRERILKQEKERYLREKEKIKKRVIEYKIKNREGINKKAREYYQKNKEKIKQNVKKWRKENPEKYKQQWRKRIKTPKSKEYRKNYYQKNKKSILGKQREYLSKPEVKRRKKITDKNYIIKHRKELNLNQVKRRKEDINYRIKCYLRSRLSMVLKKYIKTGKIISSKKYGINYKAIIEHLKPFPKDIYNYHIDHIKPLCSFDLTNPKEVKKAFAPENHQWLKAKENNLKRKFDGSQKIATINFIKAIKKRNGN